MISVKADWFKNLARFFFLSFFVLFPFQVRSLFFTVTPFVGGNFNDYTSFFIYAAELCLFLTAAFYGLYTYFSVSLNDFKVDKKLNLLVLILFLLLVLNLFFTNNLALSVLLLFRFIEILLVVYLLKSEILSKSEFVTILLFDLIIQLVLMSFQLILQHSLEARLLGEPILGVNMTGVAKLGFNQFKLMRPYGTQTHPNILGGFILFVTLYFVFFVQFKFKKELLSLLVLMVILTFSRSAILALITAFVYYYFKDLPKYRHALMIVIIISVLLMLGHGFADEERILYAGVALLMIIMNPLGVGLGGFTLNMQNFTPIKLLPWELQPVHNIFLLLGSETGVITLGLFLFILYYIFDKNASREIRAMLIAMFIIGMLDHYFYTSYQGQVIFALYMFVAVNPLKKSA